MEPPSQKPDPGNGQLMPRPPEPHPPERPPAPAYGYGYGYDYAEEPGGGTLLDYWHILRRRQGTLLLITFLGALLALLITLPQTKIYQARTTIEIQNLNPDFMNMRQVTPVEQGSVNPNRSDIDTQIEILKSETLIGRALEKLGWDRAAKLTGATGRVSAWRRALQFGTGNKREPETLTPEEVHHNILKAASDHLSVKSQGQTRIVEILFESPDAGLAAEFVNTLTNEFIDMNLEARWTSTKRTGEWLGRQLQEMRIKLEHSEDALNSYARRVGLIYTGEQQSVAEEKLRQIQEQLSQAEADRIAKQSRYEMARNSPPEVLPDILNDPTLRAYQQRLTDLRRQEAEYSTTFTPAYPKVKRIHAQILTVEAAFKQARDAILGRIQNEYEEAQRREELLRKDYARQAQLVSEQTEKAIQYNILKREVDSNRQLYETMLQRVKEASVASALGASNVRIVDAARPPKLPYKPRVALNSLLGLLLGGFFGVVFVIMRERADRSLQEPGDVSFYLEVPELGVIPAADTRRHRLLPYYRRRRRQKKETGAEDNGQVPDCVELVAWKHKPSLVAESFRTTLTSILFANKNGDRPHVLVLTSAQPMEGKTTVASNLAIALAELSRRVLLIDGDLRKPRLHEIFELTREEGLAELLLNDGPLEVALEGAVRATSIAGLYVLPAGENSEGLTSLLYSDRMADLLTYFEKNFDMVLIDTPPVLNLPDARILGRMADGVILVIRAGSTSRDTALAARDRLKEDGTTVLGSILNYWDPKKSRGGRYGYAYYYDRYHYYYRPGE